MLPLWLFLLIPYVYSSTLLPEERCVTAVYTAYNYISFTGLPAEGFWETRCQNPLKVTSIYAASQVYCSPLEQFHGLNQLESFCREFGHVGLLPREQLTDNLTDDAVDRMMVVEYRQLPKKEAVDVPVLISKDYYDVTFKTIDILDYERWTQEASGYAIYAFWTVILSVATLHRFFYHHLNIRPRSFVRSIYHCIQTHLLVPAPLSHGRTFLWCTLPTRIEAIIVILYYIINTILSCISYPVFPGNLYWPEPSDQILRYAADRTGILSFANLPLIWLFAGRNNIFCWTTGWSFATFNIFHRHVSRVATVQAIVHTVLYLVMFLKRGNAWHKMQKPYLLWGTLAMVVMIFVLVFSLDRIRRRTYELFLFVHIFFSIIALVGCFYHTIIFEAHDYWIYLWPTIAIWVVDRLLRLIRIVYCNLHVRNTRSIHHTTSIATYNHAADVIRLEISPASSLQPSPGQYYFLYQPFRLTGWESHPFTLGAWSYDSSSSLELAQKTVDISHLPLLSESSDSTPASPVELKLIFWIRPFDGWTRHLRQQCIHSPTHSTQSTVLLEGPYGEHFPIHKYESILLIAGGTGIAAAVPYIQDHILRSAIDDSVIRDIHLIWTSRQAAFINEVASRELKQALTRSDVRASFYATKPSAGDTDTEMEIKHGRPNLHSVILEHARSARLSECSAAVMVCGPMAMVDEAREAVHEALRGGYSVSYIEESIVW
ncbi:hypothetical protein ASPWEDRAFT_182854 [Aspergillus wentii DTO 134E9]|uniref:FAD-binding FR-type domain-containing protein n=1 Tax=Aspergillus wentii DTO 134E9 TaxID=1073089 RepID=A0A1L9RIL3_ASPWE|nr:uncharacterized protein ASPWEDRAFT_182854 [Aspergillus wentii DTO 134E9]KAI9932327.1 hypothetical protein MW887_009839 [Aspergillus wentii]OJJ34708.1 hypothetical protein ASPWEDRAFT_182854 [Aspergillus wentii DTO 134E9]